MKARHGAFCAFSSNFCRFDISLPWTHRGPSPSSGFILGLLHERPQEEDTPFIQQSFYLVYHMIHRLLPYFIVTALSCESAPTSTGSWLLLLLDAVSSLSDSHTTQQIPLPSPARLHPSQAVRLRSYHRKLHLNGHNMVVPLPYPTPSTTSGPPSLSASKLRRRV